MKPQFRLWAAAIVIAAASCDAGAPDPAPRPIETVDAAAEVAAMPEGQRNAVFIRAIRDANLPRTCQHVASSASAGEIGGAPAWTATCDDGTNWTIVIGANGIAQVVSDAELQAADEPIEPAQ